MKQFPIPPHISVPLLPKSAYLRALMDEVFGANNFCCQITFRKTTGKGSGLLDNTVDFILWYAKDKENTKYRPLFEQRDRTSEVNLRFLQTEDGMRRAMTKEEFFDRVPIPQGSRVYRPNPLTSARPPQVADLRSYNVFGKSYNPGNRTFSTNQIGMDRLRKSDRLLPIGISLNFIRYLDDFAYRPRTDVWEDTRTGGFGDEKYYVVQTVAKVIERCLLMTTDPGDLVLDPTCGSGTTAYVAEQWGRRWITIDTSRVSLALARSRIMGARYPYYLLADSPDGQRKEGEVTRTVPKSAPTRGDIRHGFVYERVPHITLKSIANNAEIDVIWEKWQQTLEPLCQKLNKITKKNWHEWEIPRELPANTTPHGDVAARYDALQHHAAWWEARIARQKEIDASIAAKAEFEYLYDKPYTDNSRVRVAGPFTVESLSPHRTLAVDWNDELIDVLEASEGKRAVPDRDDAILDFAQMILENLKAAGVQQAHKE